MPRVKRLRVAPYLRRGSVEIYNGDLRGVLPSLGRGRFDSVVTDPPYGIRFMGEEWDHEVPGAEFWEVVRESAKPGAHLLAFCGTRKFHRLAVAIEDAGWEVRDCLLWLYGSGFPKPLNVSKSIKSSNIFKGLRTSLKPAWEPIILARRPLDGTVCENILTYGTGALNVAACKIGDEKIIVGGKGNPWTSAGREGRPSTPFERVGRFPANVAYDGSEEVLEGLPGISRRFFYCAKVSRAERGPGNDHPTVKPLALMRWLVRLTTPPGGRVLDPFAGSGSTLLAARDLGFRSVGVELKESYCGIIEGRLGTRAWKVLKGG